MILKSSATKAKHNYYPGLDGLRAIAVIMVFCQHYAADKFFLFGWGWAGVDVFFVLSGFLITGILFDSQHQPNKYRSFYMRRTLRIFPLYYFIWLIILLLAPFVHWQWNFRWSMWPAYFGNYSRFVFLGEPGNVYRFDRLTFGQNVANWFGSPMNLYIGHFWSLCVEEQFYLLWPLVVYKVRDKNKLIKICLTIIIISPLIRFLLTKSLSPQILDLEFLYRSMPTRLDALLIGGLMALLIRGSYKDNLFRYRRILSVSSMILLILSYIIFVRIYHVPFKGSSTNWVSIFGFTLIDLCAAGVMLETITVESKLSKILNFKWLRNLGIISYGFYIYHDLFHDFYSYISNRFFQGFAYPVTLLLAFFGTWLIAWISYRLLEYPMLKLKKYFPNNIHTAPAQ